MPTSLERWLPPVVNRLALKMAGPVALVTGIGAVGGTNWALWVDAAVGFGLGSLVYGIAHLLLHHRLDQAHTALHHIRQHNFEDLTAPTGARTDELDTLRWEVYRTGQKLETEIQDFRKRENYRREFIGNVSHELKTPIFSIQGFAETLLDGALDDDDVNQTFLEKILHNVGRLENLARDLSAITKIETGEMEMSTTSFEVAPLFQEVYNSLELKAHENDVALRLDVNEVLSPVHGDPDRLRRVLVNLADNAIKYNEPGGTVALRARATSGNEIELSVADDGIGIPEEHLPRLTERFYRVDKSRSRNQGGTGLGLAIVKHILAAHDRNLTVESAPGEGSTFSFTLPTAPQPTLQAA
jgi:two-component system phosphate regulon sensor histidine kinase PhoR